MTLELVDVATWKSDVDKHTFIAGDTYEISDLSQKIAGLSTTYISDIAYPLVGIESTDASLVIDSEQAQAILNTFTNNDVPTKPYLNLAAPAGDKVIFDDSAANILGWSTYFVQQLKQAGVNAVEITDTAANLELSDANIQYAIQLGVTGLVVADFVRPEFSVDQLAQLASGSKGPISITEPAGLPLKVSDLIADEGNPSAFIPGVTYNVVDSGDNISKLLDPSIISAIPSQVTQLISEKGSVTLTVDQALALEKASLPVVVPGGSTVSVIDSAAHLVALSTDDLAALAEIGVTEIAATDTPAVFDAAQIAAIGQANISITVPPGNQLQNDGTYDVPNPNGLTIDVTWDSSVASAPTGFEAGVEAGVQILEHAILNKITVNVDIGYGEIGGNSLGSPGALPGGISEGAPQTFPTTYSDLRAALAQHETSSLGIEAVNLLPNASQLDGQTSFSVGTAEAKALDLPGANDTSPDGDLGMGLSFSGNTLVGGALHEITHAMGRIFGNSGLSLFRYTSPGNNDFTGNIPAAPSYFSLDDGVTKLADFGQGSDPSDFLNSPASALTPNDPFDEDIAGSGQLTPADFAMLEVLGFQINPVESFTAAYIEALSPSDIDYLSSEGMATLDATDGSVELTADQALDLEVGFLSVHAAPGGRVSISDTNQNIEAMDPSVILALPSIGVSVIAPMFAGPLVLNIAQAVAAEAASLTFLIRISLGGGPQLRFEDTSADIEALTTNPLRLATLSDLAPSSTTLTATDASIVLSLDGGLAFGGTQLRLVAPRGDQVIVNDSQTALDAVTTAEINQLAGLGVNLIESDPGLALNVSQIQALENDAITIETALDGTPFAGVEIIRDTAADIATMLTTQVIEVLPTLSPDTFVINSIDGQVTFSVQQIQAIEAVKETFVGFATTIAIADAASRIETLTADQIGGLFNFNTFPVPITITAGTTVEFDLAQALALIGSFAGGVAVVNFDYDRSALPNLGFVVGDKAANFANLTTAQIETLGKLNNTDVNYTFEATDTTTLVFNVALAEAISGTGSVSTLDTTTIADIAADIKALLDLGLGAVGNVLDADRVSGVAATDGPVALSVSEAETLESFDASSGQTIAVTAPVGDAVTLSDTALAIEGMSPAQLGALTSIGVSAVTVTDQSITLTVDQALALYDPVPISVPPGATVIIADNEAAIDSLTPAEVAGLAAIGVNTIEVSNLTGAGPLTIDGGITLSVGGAVPLNETITFAGAGGVLALHDTADMVGTIYGFSPPDTIDLTDVPYDSGGGAGLQTDAAGNQFIRVTAGGNTYDLGIDPSQVFLTQPTFELNPDNDGVGPGTDLTVVEPPVTSYDFVYGGQTADGVVVGSGGTVEAEAGATVNRAIVQGGGALLGDDGSTVNDTVIDTGGMVGVFDGGTLAGSVTNNGTVNFDIAGSATFDGTLSGGGTLVVSGGGNLDVVSAYTGAAQIDDISTLEFTSTYVGVATFSGVPTGPGGTLKLDVPSTGPITVVNSNDTVIVQPGGNNWINAIANYTLPANIDALFLYAGTQGTGNSDAAGDALYALNGGAAQTLTGNSANDTFVVYNSSDVVVPKANSHDVVYAAASYTLPTGVDALILEGNATQGVGNSDAAGDGLYAANPGQVATLTGNSANDTFVVYNSSDVVVPKVGSHDVVYSAVSYTLPTGVDVLILEAGTQAVGNSDAAGDALYAADAGIVQTLTGNSPNDTFVVYNSSDVVLPEAGSHDVVYSAVNYTLPTGVDSLILEAGTQAVGNSDAAGDTLYAANAGIAQTLTGNSHNDTFVVYNSGDTVIGQAGSTDTVYAAVNFTLPTNVDTLFLEGSGATHGTGNNDAVDTLFGNAGFASTLVAGNGADTLYVIGTAGTVMTGGAGADTFAFPDVMGQDEVTNFGLAKDTLQFNATLFSNFTAAMNAASQVGADTVFTVDANDTVTLDNVTKSSLTAGNFHFS